MKPKLYETETIALEKLQPHPRNYREHPDDQLNHIIKSIEQHGIYRNIVVADDYTVLAGHGVMKACKKMGLTEVPVIKLKIKPDSPQALKLLAGDNETGRLAAVNDRQLSEILKEVKDFDAVGLIGTGYDDMMLANLVMISRHATEIKDIDEAKEWLGMPDYDARENVLKVTISFVNNEDRQQFVEEHGLEVKKSSNATWSGWWPYKEQEDPSSVRYE